MQPLSSAKSLADGDAIGSSAVATRPGARRTKDHVPAPCLGLLLARPRHGELIAEKLAATGGGNTLAPPCQRLVAAAPRPTGAHAGGELPAT